MYDIRPALVRITEEDSGERGEKECERRREWMTGGRTRMASSGTGVAKSYLDGGDRASMWACLLAFNVIQCLF